MGKKHKNKNHSDNVNNNGQKKVRISEDARDFAKLDLKKFKKKEGEYYDSKKELKRAYYSRLVDDLPEAIDFVVTSGYKERENDEVREIKNEILRKIAEEKFVKYLTSCIKDGEEIDNIKMLPIILAEILERANKENASLKANDPNAEIYVMTDVMELSKLITKKKRKKLLEEGVDEKLVFDLLSVIPTEKVLKKSTNYRIRTLLNVLYNHAARTTVDVDKIMKVLIPQECETAVILFALLERRRKSSALPSDAQRALYNSITEWCFKHLEEADKSDIYGVLTRYINSRREEGSHDAERRYDFTLISENEYPKIAKIVKKIMDTTEDAEKYLK